MASKIDQSGRKPPMPKSRPKQRISRQRRKTMNATAEYNAMRDIYLKENPNCCMCVSPATQVHHIVSGTAGRARSLLNPNTWLGVCADCHGLVAEFAVRYQRVIKCEDVLRAIKEAQRPRL
jgi:hypothetical protein